MRNALHCAADVICFQVQGLRQEALGGDFREGAALRSACCSKRATMVFTVTIGHCCARLLHF